MKNGQDGNDGRCKYICILVLPGSKAMQQPALTGNHLSRYHHAHAPDYSDCEFRCRIDNENSQYIHVIGGDGEE